MFFRKIAWLVGLPAALVGCSTVFNAREAQREVAGRADGAAPAEAIGKVDLRGFSLRQYVDYALTNRPTVVSARLAVEDARLALKAVAANAPLVSSTPWTAPNVSASIGRSGSSEQSTTRIGWHTEGKASAALSLELPIWDFGRNAAEQTAAVETVLAAETELVSAGYAVFWDVTSSYFSLVQADALLEVAFTNEYVNVEHLRRTEERLENGEAKSVDVTRARLDLSRAREQVVAASNDVTTAAAEFMRALGLDARRGTRDDVLPRDPIGVKRMVRGFADTHFGVREALDLALTNAPTMVLRRARLRASSARVDAAIADLLPSVTASASLTWTDPMWAWNWGVSAVQSIFQGFRKTTAVDRAVVAMKAAAASVDEAEQELALSVETAISTRDDSAEAYRTACDSVRAAWENLQVVEAQYMEGVASRIDFADAVSDFVAAEGNLIQAHYLGQKAEAKLFELLGEMPAYDERRVEEVK